MRCPATIEKHVNGRGCFHMSGYGMRFVVRLRMAAYAENRIAPGSDLCGKRYKIGWRKFTFIFRNQQHNHATRTCQNVIPTVNLEFAKRSIRFIAPSAYNSTRGNIIDKIYTHSFVGFCIYVTFQLIDSYNIVCSTRNCFSCR